MKISEMGLRCCARNCTSDARIDGKTVIITGGNAGIGKETAIDLAKRGGKIIICCRNQERAENAVKDIKAESGSDNVHYYLMDLASLQSVRDCCKQIIEKETQIDILINNAGIFMVPYSKTVDGYESQFATNHLGHFLFTLLLWDKIKQSKEARIIVVSSDSHADGVINFEDINCEKSYSPIGAYGNSKLANVLFARELAKRTKDSDIHVYCVHPGFVKTNIFSNIKSWVIRGFIKCSVACVGRTTKQGAQTLVYCAVDEQVAKDSGLYYLDCRSLQPCPLALDDELATKLWDVSLEMVGLTESPI